MLHRIAGVRDRFFILCDDWTGGTGEAVSSFARTSNFRMRFIGQVRSDVHGLPKKVSLELLRTPQVLPEARPAEEAGRVLQPE